MALQPTNCARLSHHSVCAKDRHYLVMTTPLGPGQRSGPGFIIRKIGGCAPCDKELHHRHCIGASRPGPMPAPKVRRPTIGPSFASLAILNNCCRTVAPSSADVCGPRLFSNIGTTPAEYCSMLVPEGFDKIWRISSDICRKLPGFPR